MFPKAKDNRSEPVRQIAKNKKPCIPKPFYMPGEVFRAKYEKQFLERIQQEQKAARELSQFHSTPMPNFYPKTYAETMNIEVPSQKEGFMLATNKRMQERELYEQYKQRKEEEQKMLKQQ